MTKTKYELGEYVLVNDDIHSRYIVGNISSISSINRIYLDKDPVEELIYTINFVLKSYNVIDTKKVEVTENQIVCLVTGGTFFDIYNLKFCEEDTISPKYNINETIYVDNNPYIVCENRFFDNDLGEFVYLLRSDDASQSLIFKYEYELSRNKIDINQYIVERKNEEDSKLAVHIDYEEDKIPDKNYIKTIETLTNTYNRGDIVLIEKIIDNKDNSLYDDNIVITEVYMITSWLIKNDVLYYICIPLNYKLDYPLLIPYYDIKSKIDMTKQ